MFSHKRRIRALALIGTLGSTLLFRPAVGSAACDPPVGSFVSVEGAVEVQQGAGIDPKGATLETELCEGDVIRVGDRSRATVALINEAVLRIDQNSAVLLIDIVEEEEATSILDIVKGAFQSFSRSPRLMTVNTPYLNGSVEGTEFVVRVDDEATDITAFEGLIRAANCEGEVALRPGQTARATAGQAPLRRTLDRPRDQAEWALYYPPIFSAAAFSAHSPLLEDAAKCAERGDSVCAFSTLEAVPVSQRDHELLLLRASVLLSVGRVGEARTDIDQALQEAPGEGRAYALRSVIALAENAKAQSLADARRGVELSPDAPSTKIALSYALESSFQVAEAKETMSSAVERHPNDALAWARLAELRLMLGDRSEAIAAAKRAEQLRPDLGRAHYVLGFAALSAMDTTGARAAFERAIQLSPTDPMAHVGLGLTRIRVGQLAEGRAELEASVALDPSNALLRAYLGKAYFEERRKPLDGDQFTIAKELDGADPTAFLYDSIRSQTINRPVEAIDNLRQSTTRNDDRTIYRGRLLLDQDRAVRAFSHERIYKDLGFMRRGIEESRRSLAYEPANASAHRALSDSYVGLRRRETARVSEMLQAQMLQDININPVQPSLSETNLNTLLSSDLSQTGLSTFTPMITRDQVRLDATGFAGSNATGGGEAVASALYGRFSLSAGAYHYNTDGWRPNNDLRHDIYNIFAQAAVSPHLNIQAEYRSRASREGDLAFNFDPADFSADRKIERDEDTARVGLRISPTRHSNLMLSYIHTDRRETLTETKSFGPFTSVEVTGDREDEGDQWEVQYLQQLDRFNLAAGLGYGEIDTRLEESLRMPPDAQSGSRRDLIAIGDEETTQSWAYLYANIDITPAVLATMGVGYVQNDQELLQKSTISPKAGIRWSVTDRLQVRAAAFKTVKPPLVSDRTLEPTQIAGFNQLFEDPDATESDRYGIGFDWQPFNALSVGGELTWRDLDVPVFRPTVEDVVFEDRDEQLHRAYLYWTPADRWSVTAEFVYDLFRAEDGISTDLFDLPEKVETISLPVSVRYFDPSGLFAGISGTYVDQDVQRSELAARASGQDSFFLVDAAIGYRLPKRYGILSVEVKNVFDEEFFYQDDSYRQFGAEPVIGPYFPDRTVVGKISFSF